MFKKLISNLPFNPSLIGEVAFYAKRMHSEASVRRLGVVFVVLAMLVQVFAIISPPEATIAASSNDIIRGGFSSRSQAVNYCRANTSNFADILAHYEISCNALAAASTQTIRSTAHNKQLHSMGRNPQGPVISRTGKPTNEYAVNISGKRYYMRNLWAWDTYASSSYKMLVVRNASGKTVMIMYNCGNIVTIGKYTPPKKPQPPKPRPPVDACPKVPGFQYTQEECDVCPNVPGEQSDKNECYPCPEAVEDNAITACLELSKQAENITKNIRDANGTEASAGDVITYSLTTKNKGNQTVKDFIVEENMADVLEYGDIVNLHGGVMNDENIVSWPKEDIAAGAVLTKKITVKVKNPIPQTPVSSSDPGSNDLVMTNVYYGSSVNIKLPASPIKTVELTTQTLPETGPGTTVAIGFLVTTVSAYFLARSRLLAKELDIVRTDFSASGGAS